MDDVLDIMELFKSSYPSWKGESIKDIYYHIYPSIALKQYAVNKDENGEIYGYTNWAFFNKEAEKHFLDNRFVRMNDWHDRCRMKRNRLYFIAHPMIYLHLYFSSWRWRPMREFSSRYRKSCELFLTRMSWAITDP